VGRSTGEKRMQPDPCPRDIAAGPALRKHPFPIILCMVAAAHSASPHAGLPKEGSVLQAACSEMR